MKTLLLVFTFVTASAVPSCSSGSSQATDLDTFLGYANAAAAVADANANASVGPVACRALEATAVAIPAITSTVKLAASGDVVALPGADIDVAKCGDLPLPLSTDALDKAGRIVDATVCGVTWAGDVAFATLELLTAGKATVSPRSCLSALSTPVLVPVPVDPAPEPFDPATDVPPQG